MYLYTYVYICIFAHKYWKTHTTLKDLPTIEDLKKFSVYQRPKQVFCIKKALKGLLPIENLERTFVYKILSKVLCLKKTFKGYLSLKDLKGLLSIEYLKRYSDLKRSAIYRRP